MLNQINIRVYSSGEKFNLTIDTTIDELVNQPTSLPTIRLSNQPQDNVLEPRLFQNVDDDGTIVTPTLLTPSRKTPKDERTNGYTIDLVNGDIMTQMVGMKFQLTQTRKKLIIIYKFII